MRVTIVHKNQNTMPPHLPSHPCHEVEVCRRKEVSMAKVTILPFSDNHADTICKVLARDRLVIPGILPSVNFTKQKRVAKPGISVRSQIIRLMNNQTKSPKMLLFQQKKRKRRQGCGRNCENCTTIGMRLARNSPGETRCKKSWDRFERYGSLSLRYV